MIAHYGYKDGAGEFFISIDTAKCAKCMGKPCIAACKGNVLEIMKNDYDEEVVGVKEEHHKKLEYSCSPCKPANGEHNLACQAACTLEAIMHSW